MRRKKKSLVFIIFLAFACLGIGYAYLTTTLSINGTTDVDSNNWDVYFDNIQIIDGSVTGTQVIDDAEIVDDITVSFHINLKEPGEFYGFTVDVKNDGTIDAMIESISKKLNGIVVTTLPAYLNYTVTYEDNSVIQPNHMILADSIETYKVIVEYRDDINPEDLPSSAQSLTLSFGVNYIQANSNGIRMNRDVYSIERNFEIGKSLPTSVTIYDSYQEMINDNPYLDAFLKHTVSRDKISKSYIGIIRNDTIYYIQGGVDEFDLSTKSIYESNKEVFNTIFGSSNCTEETSAYVCYDAEYYAYDSINTDGRVVYNNCVIGSDKKSKCGLD